MRGKPQSPARRAPDLGLERVSWVRIVHDAGGTRCQVAGIAHRRPVIRPVPLRTATALVAAGVPAVVRSEPGDGGDEGDSGAGEGTRPVVAGNGR